MITLKTLTAEGSMATYSLEELRFNDIKLKAEGRINFPNPKGAIQKQGGGSFGQSSTPAFG